MLFCSPIGMGILEGFVNTLIVCAQLRVYTGDVICVVTDQAIDYKACFRDDLQNDSVLKASRVE